MTSARSCSTTSTPRKSCAHYDRSQLEPKLRSHVHDRLTVQQLLDNKPYPELRALLNKEVPSRQQHRVRVQDLTLDNLDPKVAGKKKKLKGRELDDLVAFLECFDQPLLGTSLYHHAKQGAQRPVHRQLSSKKSEKPLGPPPPAFCE